MWQQKLADQESKGKAFASEIRELRAQLEAVLKKVPPGVPPTIEVPDASTPGRQAARRSGAPARAPAHGRVRPCRAARRSD
jgi:hypothetical protein